MRFLGLPRSLRPRDVHPVDFLKRSLLERSLLAWLFVEQFRGEAPNFLLQGHFLPAQQEAARAVAVRRQLAKFSNNFQFLFLEVSQFSLRKGFSIFSSTLGVYTKGSHFRHILHDR
jgi:hypothetical protein